MHNHEKLYQRLVELGADALDAMFEALRHETDLDENVGESHYFKGGFQALKEAAESLFNTCSDDFRSDCMTVVSSYADARKKAAEVSRDT